MFKIYNPYTNLFFGGMHPNGAGGHLWTEAGREFKSRQSAMISFRVAFHKIPADFILMEFDNKNNILRALPLDQIQKINLIYPNNKDYSYYVHEHIKYIGIKT